LTVNLENAATNRPIDRVLGILYVNRIHCYCAQVAFVSSHDSAKLVSATWRANSLIRVLAMIILYWAQSTSGCYSAVYNHNNVGYGPRHTTL
jgi:hypothetical protein